MKTMRKITMLALLGLFIGSNLSCRKQKDEEYDVPEDDGPQVGMLSLEESINHIHTI